MQEEPVLKKNITFQQLTAIADAKRLRKLQAKAKREEEDKNFSKEFL